MRNIPLDIGTLHFVGIGGIGMSGIAEILQSMDYVVQGSDISENANVKRLRAKGIDISIGHDAKNLADRNGDPVAAVVVSSAIKKNNPELVEARALKIPVVRRADMLAELMRLKWAIAVGGTHGKTTTTSLIGAILEEADRDPTVINGGIIHAYGTNTRLGKSEWMVVESDESDGSFTRLPATVAVITNIDPEHMDHYGSFEDVKDAYRSFAENVPFYGFSVLCMDHPEVQMFIPELTDRKCLTYGFSKQADICGKNIRFGERGATFDVTISLANKDSEKWEDIYLPMPGEHNVQNTLAAIAIAHELGISETVVKKALRGFQGVNRRFTITGEAQGITIVDDYGHHPVEVAAVLKAARQMLVNDDARVFAVMQPHRFSRLHELMDDFSASFNDADTVFITDVYAASEDPIEGADKETLVEKIRSHGHKNAHVVEDRQQLVEKLFQNAKRGDMVVCLGAGDITAWAHALPDEISEAFKGKSKSTNVC